MSRPMIHVEGLSKAYRLGHKESTPDTLVGAMSMVLRAPWNNLRQLRELGSVDPQSQSEEVFWALKDVNFQVNEGDVVGVIGKNGAGKSTLLKILSRITEPTSGRAVIRGRVSSLLEVGTGFHPELTGRENIYMNGTVLGMKKREIDRKFDEIVAFSGVEKFLDMPTKRYSSGMQVRLAFAVAAHLEPEVLIIDEVLAVGDAEFQKKCLGKMREVARGGRTILFVSHNMSAVESLCNKAVQLSGGTVIAEGSTQEVLHEYMNAILKRGYASQNPLDAARYLQGAQLTVQGKAAAYVTLGQSFAITMQLKVPETLIRPRLGIGVNTLAGDRVFTVHTPREWTLKRPDEQIQEIVCQVPSSPLPPGSYTVKLALSDLGREVEAVEDVLPFTVLDDPDFNDGNGYTRGCCIAQTSWTSDIVQPV